MSYQIAYTTHFHSLDNTLWNIDIYINDYASRPTEICLEGDEPCVIDWQETGKTDVVQSSTCTLRVSNESDRQMAQLMTHPDALLVVSREGKWYWFGHLDDAVYEEPYSFKKAYVTELTFTDFGILNRIPFRLKGRRSVKAIVRDCLDSIGYGNGSPYNLYTSLLEPKTQQPITLDMLYINADRFESDDGSWDNWTSKREVLEEILRPLGLRIMQKNAQIYIYDIEYLRDHAIMHSDIVWKGTDAYLKGSETFGWYEVAFETDAEETLANGKIDYDSLSWPEEGLFFVRCYDESHFAHDNMGFYIQAKGWLWMGLEQPADISPNAMFFRTRAFLTDSNDVGIAWRITCKTVDHYVGNEVIWGDRVLVDNLPAKSLAGTETVFSVETGYLPIVPDRDKYQLRVNLDFVLSFRPNPFDNPPEEWVEQQDWYINKEKDWRTRNHFSLLVPVKLEVLDDNGNAIYHYKNVEIAQDTYYPVYGNSATVVPSGINEGKWEGGAASFGDMVLAYYKDYDRDDTDRDPLVTKGAWTTNRIALSQEMQIAGSLYRVRDDGEYLPMPPVAGKLRLTVGSGVFPFPSPTTINIYSTSYEQMTWQLYRNPKITLVRAHRRDDGINTDTVYEKDMINFYSDHLKETVKAGCWRKGIAPSARGLLFNASGTVWEKFIKNGSLRTLEEHRLCCIEDQAFYTQPVISGTAELDVRFCAKRENNTPGVFLVTSLRQNLHQDTEEVTMARIANVGSFVYEFAWSEPYCVEEENPYTFQWSRPLCAKDPGPYKFSWSNGVCAMQYIYLLEWEEMQSIID